MVRHDDVVLVANAAGVRANARAMFLSAVWRSSILLLMYDALILTAVVARVQRLALVIAQQVQRRILILFLYVLANSSRAFPLAATLIIASSSITALLTALHTATVTAS